jgi:hypothetical protein
MRDEDPDDLLDIIEGLCQRQAARLLRETLN